MKKLICVSLTWVAFVLGMVAEAEDNQELLMKRRDCAPLYAVQKRSCVMQRVYHCDLNGQSIQRVESIDESGLFFVDFTDLDGNTIESWWRGGANSVLEIVEVRKLFSRAKLASTGIDNFDLTWLTINPWFAEPIQEIIFGEIKVTGEVLNIDGVMFTVAIHKGYTQTNSFREDYEKYEYLDLDTGAFFWGGSPEEGEPSYAPVEVIFPKKPEFQIDRPQYDCGAMSSIAPLKGQSTRG